MTIPVYRGVEQSKKSELEVEYEKNQYRRNEASSRNGNY